MVLPGAPALYLRLQGSPTGTDFCSHAYWVANKVVATDVPITELGIGVPNLHLSKGGVPASPGVSDHDGVVVFRDLGWIAGKWRWIRCVSGDLACRLAVAGVGVYRVTQDGKNIDLLSASPQASRDALIQTLLGPALVLALALQGTWCLHASAVLWQGQAIALLGESGSGKSTLAAFLGVENGVWGQRLADDVLPVAPDGANLVALPRFPQLKLSPEEHFNELIPERVPLTALYILSAPDAGEEKVALQPLAPRQAALALIRHTVASRLFDDALMARHLAFCSETATQIPVRLLAYPRRREALPQVRDQIAADLEVLARG